MAEEKKKRKLTAIFSADVKGYSRLMADDEEATVNTINAYRAVMTDLIQGHDGRVVDAKGDNVLAEFPSVVDAVRCAVDVQKELKTRNADLPEHRKMEFRIGVNLGDVIEEKETIYGDGVNVAARLEGMAEPGGLCISGTAFDQVRDKLDLGYAYLGEQSVKNILRPIRAYNVLMAPEYVGKMIGEVTQKPKQWRWAGAAIAIIILAGAWAVWNFHFRPPPIEPASLQKMAYPLPDKPSIAVLPFTNISGDSKQDYVADGLTEEIITALAKIPRLFVIASNSVFTYKGKPVKVQQVSEELGVRYVLEGSVRKSENQVRITAQLIDAVKGHHLWAKKYEGKATDLFSLQDGITRDILISLEVKLTEGEQARMWRKSTTNPKAYDLFLQALEAIRLFSKDGNILAREKSEESLELEPDFSGGLIALGWTYLRNVSLGWGKSPQEDLAKSYELAQKAVSLYDDLASPHALLGSVYLIKRKYDEALSEGKRAVELGPNEGDIVALYGYLLREVGRYRESIEFLERAVRLNPMTPNLYFSTLAGAYQGLGNNDRAMQLYEKVVKRNPNHFPAWVRLTLIYMEIGEDDKAHKAAKEVLRLNPKFSVENYIKATPPKDQAFLNRMKESLIEAGLPRTPPLPLPDKPSIAVLPFDNMSGDPEQEYFSDGITEEIITALSKVPDLFVIARNSSFTYKGKSVWVPTVGRELGVRYVLEGSVRKAGDKVRVTAQLIEANTNRHLWAERYDRDLKDIFAIQDEITLKILKALDIKAIYGEAGRLHGKGTDNLEAYLKMLQARKLALEVNKESNFMARQLTEEVVHLDPQYPLGYHGLAIVTAQGVLLGMSKSPAESLMEAIGLEKKAISLDPSFANFHAHLGMLYGLIREYEKSVAEGELAIKLAPNSSDAHAFMVGILNLSGRPEEALKHIETIFRLEPLGAADWYYWAAAQAYRLTGQYEDGIKMARQLLSRWPNHVMGHLALTLNYAAWGRDDEAHAAAQEFMRINPKFSARRYVMTVPYKDPNQTVIMIELMRKAGLPD
ncbi:MAG: tetratricopeptide repeat protein [Deltaproteobacteria bacterium]|nr:tetratricopeptide repeat protein [Deltaproteobacteria bacterium]